VFRLTRLQSFALPIELRSDEQFREMLSSKVPGRIELPFRDSESHVLTIILWNLDAPDRFRTCDPGVISTML